jgi:hypothetical protein
MKLLDIIQIADRALQESPDDEFHTLHLRDALRQIREGCQQEHKDGYEILDEGYVSELELQASKF